MTPKTRAFYKNRHLQNIKLGYRTAAGFVMCEVPNFYEFASEHGF